MTITDVILHNLKAIRRFRHWVGRQRPRTIALPNIPQRVTRGFEETEAVASSIEGMMSRFSMQVMDAVLSQQRRMNVGGYLAEFGVYKGKSAAVISAHVHPGERLLLVDIERYITDETVAKLFVTPEFWLGRSEDFARMHPDYTSFKRSVRFMHIDSGHGYRTTLAEMELADRLLADGGVVCLDDFTNLNYSQILPAIYKYLFTTKTDLTVFLVTNEKAYLCRRAWFDRYAKFVLEHLVGEMAKRGNPSVTIARTDADPEYRAFYLRPRAQGETERYGEAIYRHFYESV
jgi:hypothetical protein